MKERLIFLKILFILVKLVKKIVKKEYLLFVLFSSNLIFNEHSHGPYS